MTVSFNDIQKAASTIGDSIIRTHCTRSEALSTIAGTEVILKYENHQFTGSFKDRGALNKLLSLTKDEKQRGVIAMSAGNHAQAVACHARRLAIAAVIVMPRWTPHVKVERTQAFGAEVILHGDGLDESRRFAQDLARERSLTLIHPYDDEKIIAGQGTVALEMLEESPDLDVLMVPVGGGGLISGMAIAAKGIKADIEVVGVQTAQFPCMVQALREDPKTCGTSTFAEGIAVREPGAITLAVVREQVDHLMTVEESEIESAVLMLLEKERTVVEGAGAVGLAALIADPGRFKGQKAGLVLSGGNIDLQVLSSIIQRGLVRSGRLVRLHVGMPDVPGALSHVTRILGEKNANIIDVQHQRAFTNLGLRQADVEFVIQTLGMDHVKKIMDTLKQADYRVSLQDMEMPFV